MIRWAPILNPHKIRAHHNMNLVHFTILTVLYQIVKLYYPIVPLII
jgi:hypothetical protein